MFIFLLISLNEFMQFIQSNITHVMFFVMYVLFNLLLIAQYKSILNGLNRFSPLKAILAT